MSWTSDKIFQGNPEDRHEQLKNWARPAFRLGLLSSIHQAHPFKYVNEYQALFEVFEPILKRDAERLLFLENTRNYRRRKSIKSEDWKPFQHLKDAVPGDDFTFIGFQFQSGKIADDVFDAGPTAFRMIIRNNTCLDATVPVDSFNDGTLNVNAMKQALLRIPTRSGFAGYGMCLSEDFPGNGPNQHAHPLRRIVHKYPALDVAYLRNRGWTNGSDDDPLRTWILGLNWLTQIGEPFLSRLGGVKALTDGLDSRIQYEVGDDTVLFQIGDRPITGEKDVDDDTLYLYSELGQRLKPLGNGTPSMAHPRSPFTQYFVEESVSWERRFYDGEWFKENSKNA